MHSSLKYHDLYIVSGDFEQTGVGFEAGCDDEAGGEEERDRCSIYWCQKLTIHVMKNVRRVPLKFGGIISRSSMG